MLPTAPRQNKKTKKTKNKKQKTKKQKTKKITFRHQTIRTAPMIPTAQMTPTQHHHVSTGKQRSTRPT
jgi:hypothetical protein